MNKSTIWLVSFGDILTLLLCFAIVPLSGNFNIDLKNQQVTLQVKSANPGTQIANLKMRRSVKLSLSELGTPRRVLRTARREKAIRTIVNLPMGEESLSTYSVLKGRSRGQKLSFNFSGSEEAGVIFRVIR